MITALTYLAAVAGAIVALAALCLGVGVVATLGVVAYLDVSRSVRRARAARAGSPVFEDSSGPTFAAG